MAAEHTTGTSTSTDYDDEDVRAHQGDDFVRRTVSSTVLTARVPHTCSWCGEPIRIGRVYERNAVILWDGPDHPVAFARHIPTCPAAESV